MVTIVICRIDVWLQDHFKKGMETSKSLLQYHLKTSSNLHPLKFFSHKIYIDINGPECPCVGFHKLSLQRLQGSSPRREN